MVFGERFDHRNLVILAGDAEALDFEHAEFVLQISITAVIAHEPQIVSALAQCDAISRARDEWPEPSPETP